MLILNNRELKKDGEVLYSFTRQIKRGSRDVMSINCIFPAGMRLANAERKSEERRFAAQAILRMRRKLMKEVRGARGGC